MLYLLGGFMPLQTGRIGVAGRAVEGLGPDRGFVLQSFVPFPWKQCAKTCFAGSINGACRRRNGAGLRAYRSGSPERLCRQLPFAVFGRDEIVSPDVVYEWWFS